MYFYRSAQYSRGAFVLYAILLFLSLVAPWWCFYWAVRLLREDGWLKVREGITTSDEVVMCTAV